jgi:hypothetical protein
MRYELRTVLITAVGTLLVVFLQAGAAKAADPGDLDVATIVVRTYTPPELEGQIRTARRIATGILERARIQIEWLECGLPRMGRASSGACSQPLQSHELVVRILSTGTMASRQDGDTLGFAFVDLDAGGGSLATVFADRVRLMAERAGVAAAELLGKTMAHEIGHLLLGTNEHAAQGLMRACWSSADLRRNRATEWLFVGREGEVMRKGIASRFRSWSVADREVADAFDAVGRTTH